jgi:hypothetical protein
MSGTEECTPSLPTRDVLSPRTGKKQNCYEMDLALQNAPIDLFLEIPARRDVLSIRSGHNKMTSDGVHPAVERRRGMPIPILHY